MKDLFCPNCQTILETIKEPDFEYEKCPNCLGIFLDKGELNLLTIGQSGNIELSFVNQETDDKNYNNRICPKCNVEMQLVKLGQYSEIYFDFCTKCNGYFLDNSKEGEINNYLKSFTNTKSEEEFRNYINGILVRVDIEEGHGALGTNNKVLTTKYVIENYLLISAYYKNPLNIDLYMTQEGLIFKMLKMLFRNKNIAIHSGNKEFDAIFNIHATDYLKFQKHFNETVLKRILRFVERAPKAYTTHGKLLFYDDKVTYREGPYNGIPAYKDNEKFDWIISDLVGISNSV